MVDELTVAVREVMAGFGVYRTYRRGVEKMAERDRRVDPPADVGPRRAEELPAERGLRVGEGKRVHQAIEMVQMLAKLRSRSSSGSIPSFSAASLMFDSTAQLICGLPKPRKAVEGTVCDRIERALMRAAGQL